MIFKALIIDDEEPARLRLAKLLEPYKAKVEILGFAKNGSDGLAKIKSLHPDLIFLDIQMPGMSGFEMLSNLEKTPIVIFCTAYEQYALKAFETNSLDYLVKPVKEERLEQSMQKLNQFNPGLNKADIQNILKYVEDTDPKKRVTSLAIKYGKKVVFLKLKDIVYFEANEKYVNVFLKDGKSHLSEQSLLSLADKTPENFRQIHRAIIINEDYVAEVQTYFNSRFAFEMSDQKESKLISGRSFQEKIKSWIHT